MLRKIPVRSILFLSLIQIGLLLLLLAWWGGFYQFLLPAAVLAVSAFRWWEAWRWGGPFQPLTLLACGLLTLSMAAGLLLGVLAGALWAKKE